VDWQQVATQVWEWLRPEGTEDLAAYFLPVVYGLLPLLIGAISRRRRRAVPAWHEAAITLVVAAAGAFFWGRGEHYSYELYLACAAVPITAGLGVAFLVDAARRRGKHLSLLFRASIVVGLCCLLALICWACFVIARPWSVLLAIALSWWAAYAMWGAATDRGPAEVVAAQGAASGEAR